MLWWASNKLCPFLKLRVFMSLAFKWFLMKKDQNNASLMNYKVMFYWQYSHALFNNEDMFWEMQRKVNSSLCKHFRKLGWYRLPVSFNPWMPTLALGPCLELFPVPHLCSPSLFGDKEKQREVKGVCVHGCVRVLEHGWASVGRGRRLPASPFPQAAGWASV